MSTYLPPGTPVRVLRPDLPDPRPGTVRCADCDWSVAAVEAAAWRELAAHRGETACGQSGAGTEASMILSDPRNGAQTPFVPGASPIRSNRKDCIE